MAWPGVYDELRRLAAVYLREERPDHTLQPTALVHEAYLRLLGQQRVDYSICAQFLGVAAQMMRRILTNHALARQAAKRGGADAVRLTLDDAIDFYEARDVNVIAVDEALKELAVLDARQAQIIEMRFFGGLTMDEVAEALGISAATVNREVGDGEAVVEIAAEYRLVRSTDNYPAPDPDPNRRAEARS